jgi:hypothetical protein
MNTYLSTTAIITSIPSIESDTEVVIVVVIIFFIIMIAVTVVLILVTSIWFGTLLCLDATFTSTATGLSTKEANSTQIIAKETQSEKSKKSCLMFRGIKYPEKARPKTNSLHCGIASKRAAKGS